VHEATIPPGATTRHISARAASGVRDEVQDELRERGVERLVRPRQLFRRCLADVCAWDAGGAGREERLGRIGRGDGFHAQVIGEYGCERAGAAAHVERAHPGLDPGEVDEERREQA
jgi:hypothetical protein